MREENPELFTWHPVEARGQHRRLRLLSSGPRSAGDSSVRQLGGALPKDQYETFAMPYQKRVVEAIKAKHPSTPVIIYMAPDIHSKDGQFLDLLATTGVNCVSLDYTVDFADVRAKMPDHLALQGNLDPKLLRDGPLEKIKEETEKSCRLVVIRATS